MSNKKYILFFASIVLIILLLGIVKADILSACGTISTSGYYELEDNITSANTCITIESSNVEIDCKGHTIEYANTGTATRFGIDVVLGTTMIENITIRDCTIKKPSSLNTAGYGIRMQRTSYSQIINNKIQTNGTTNNYGIYVLTDSDNLLIENNTIEAYGTSTGNIAIFLSAEVRDSIIRNNNVSGTGTTTSHALHLQYSRDNIIENNNFSSYTLASSGNTDMHTVYFRYSSERNVFRNNYVYFNGYTRNYAFYAIENSNRNEIVNNTIITNSISSTNYGMYIVGSDNNLIENNTINTYGTTANYGIYLHNSAANNVINNNSIITDGTTTNNYGIYLNVVLFNNITNNFISANGDTTGNMGIYVLSSPKNNILNNTISTSGTTTGYGIGFSGSNYNTVNENKISTLCTAGTTNCYGIYSTGSDYNQAHRNNISTSGVTGNSGIYTTLSTNNVFNSNYISAYGTTTLNTGITFYTSSNYNTAFNNTISTYGTTTNYGVYVYSANRNNVSTNQISTDGTTTNHGIYLQLGSDRNDIEYNNISAYGTSTNYGIEIVNGNNNSVTGNFIIANGSVTASGTTTSNYGIRLSATSFFNHIINNTIYNGGGRYNYGIYVLTSSASNDFIGNNVNAGGTGARNAGFYLSESRSNLLENNVISASGSGTSYAIWLESNSRHNLIERNNLSTSGGATSYGIYLSATAPNYPHNNTFKENNFIDVYSLNLYVANAEIDNLTLRNQEIVSYTFTGTGSFVIVKNDSYGEIRFLERLTSSGESFSNNVYLYENLAYISSESGVNKPAEITLYGISTTSNELQILKNGSVCNDCTNLTSMKAGNVTFNVTGTGTYSIQPASSLPNITLEFPENEYSTNQQNINFNFTTIDDSVGELNCSIYINNELDLTNSSVINGTLTNFLVENIQEGEHSWYVECFDSAGNREISETRNFTVNLFQPYVIFDYPSNNSYFDNIESITLNYTLIDNNLREMDITLYGGYPNGTYVILDTSENVINGTQLNYYWENLSLGRYNWSLIVDNGINNSEQEYYYFNLINLTLNCEAGGPYQTGANMITYGNLSDGTSNLAFQTINLSVYNEGVLQDSKEVNTTSDGSFQGVFSGLDEGSYVLNASISYNGVNKSCSDNFEIGGGAVQTPASLNVDKIASFYNITEDSFSYNITLKVTNKGGSNATFANLTDSDSGESPYDLGTLEAGETEVRSYLKNFSRNSSDYYVYLSIASVEAIDSYSSSVISANSTEITLVIPSIETQTQITITKNVEFMSENSTSVTYNITSIFVNSGGTDLSGISVIDSDIDLDESIGLNRTQTYSSSGEKIIDKQSNSFNYIFEKANASYNSEFYESNELSVLIPSLESNAFFVLHKSASFYAETNDNLTLNITLSLSNLGGRNATGAFIYDSDSGESPYDLGTLEAGETEVRSYLKNFSRELIGYQTTLAVATANATDSISGNLIETNSSQIQVYIPARESSASLNVDKIASFYNLTNETITYNITLRTINIGGSNATSLNLIDSDSSESPYDIGTLQSGEIKLVSYLVNFSRNSTEYSYILAVASLNGSDSLNEQEISANSSEIIIIVPATTTEQQLTLIKNVYFNSENSTLVNYTLMVEVINSGGEDLSGITILDSDLDLNELINLNRTQSYNYSDSIILAKTASNREETFAKASATVNSITYQSNQLRINIPGYGGPADTIVYAPSLVNASTNFDTIIQIINQNPDIGQNFIVDYWITNNDETTNYSSGQQTIYVSALGSTNLTVSLMSPSTNGTYRFRALTSYIGGPDYAFASFEITLNSSGNGNGGDGGSGGSGGSGGGGNNRNNRNESTSPVTGNVVNEIICNPPYVRHGSECCLDKNNNLICDRDEEQDSRDELQDLEDSKLETEKFQIEGFINELIRITGNQIESFKDDYGYLSRYGLLVILVIFFGFLIFLVRCSLKIKNKEVGKLSKIKGINVSDCYGNIIGKVKEVYLDTKNNRIYGWVIKLNKKYYVSGDREYLVMQKHVKSVRQIMIIDRVSSDYLRKKLNNKD